jgi:hypothetical protein
MNTRYLMTAACVAALTFSPLAAMAQQTNGPVQGDQAASNSQSGSTSNAQQSLTNGGSSANNGGVTVGPSTSTSDSASQSGSVAVSESHGGAADSHSQATGGTSSAVTGASTSNATNAASNAGNAQTTIFNSTAPNSVRTVPTTYAPALTTTLTETCMGSTSAGGSWLGGGISIGSTWEDKSCKRRLNARELAQTLGDREAARAVMCGDPDVADAYERLGRPCPKSPAYKSEIAAQYMPQLPTPPAPLPPQPPVIVNVQPPAPVVTPMAPVPNPPEPRVRYGNKPWHAKPKNVPACKVDPHYACPAAHD